MSQSPTHPRRLIGALTCVLLLIGGGCSERPIYRESRVPAYTLPSLLEAGAEPPASDRQAWRPDRRRELQALFREHVYGPLPSEPPVLRADSHSVEPNALGGRALRKQVTLQFTPHEGGPRLDVLVYLPADATGPTPVFAGLNFGGNHTVTAEPAIRMPRGWVPDRPDVPSADGEPVERARGARYERWSVKRIVEHGYGLVTAYYGDLFPDRPGGFADSIYPLLAEAQAGADEGSGGAISAWAWGLHRLMDYAVRDDAIDEEHVVAMGHSRLAKAALWAGATDSRFAAVIDNASGCGGSALFRRRYGQRIVHIDTSFPHWFRDSFSRYRENESALPVDQHQLLALIAPRPLFINAMTDDRWADPRGMFLAAKHASPVWSLLGRQGLATSKFPAPGTAVLSRVGFRLREGEHSIRGTDWWAFLDFVDRHVAPTAPGDDGT